MQEITLRKWQERAIREYFAAAQRDYLIEATPGAGKTRLALTIAERQLRAALVERVIVVVPFNPLRWQWTRSAHEVGIDLEPNWGNDVGAWPTDMHGLVVTYSQVASNPLLFRHHVGRRTLVILDEIHHCQTEAKWGSQIAEAFEGATFRLALSGTPFRSDKKAIPFVNYIDGVGRPDFSYGYSDAMQDRVCRVVAFPRHGGTAKWLHNSEIREATFDDDLDEAEQSRRLNTALHPSGEWIRETLRQAHSRLSEARRDDHRAGGIVFCKDQDHAARVAGVMRSVLGVEPIVVVSDDPGAADKLQAFATGSEPWIVSVRMVSEGCDIPRLCVGVFATNYADSELFFRQALGRIVRMQGPYDEKSAVMFIPDDPRLRQFAYTIQQQVDAHLAEERETRERDSMADAQRTSSEFLPLSSTAEAKGTILEGHELSPQELERAQQIKLLSGATAAMSDEAAAMLLRNAGAPAVESVEAPGVSRAQQKRELKAEGTRLVRLFAFQNDVPHDTVNIEMARRIGTTVDKADLQQLAQRIEIAERWLERGEMA